MKKIAIISSYCYSHIEFELIPFLSERFEIGWFPFFERNISESTISNFIARKECLNISFFKHFLLPARQRALKTRAEYKKMLCVIKQYKPDILYVNADGFPWLPLLIKKFFYDIPVIAAIHDVKAHSNSGFISMTAKKILPHLYKKLNTYSDYSYAQLIQCGLKNKQITCCHHPLTDYGTLSKKKHNKFTVLFFGNVLSYKGIPLLLNAGEKAYSKNQNILIRICGKGPDDYLLNDYKKHPAFDIVNRRIDDKEIPSMFSDVDCLALPYTDATQSGPMMIALNYNVPVLATDIPAFRWYGEKFSEIHLLKNNVEVWTEEFLKRADIFQESFKQTEQYENEIRTFRYEIQKEWIGLFENA